jgi:hypothetical protein
MTEKIQKVLSSILEQFKTGDIPQAIAYSRYPIPNIPSAKWSLLNQLLVYFSGTSDARGFNQWKAVNRYIKKGSTAIHILVPWIKSQADDNGEEISVLKGFMARPIFKVEDTEGEPLDYQNIPMPDLPLLDRAKEWGIDVKTVGGSLQFSGYYLYKSKEIGLASPEEKTFFHELSHVAHEKVLGKLKAGQHPNQEIVAELSAQALCRLVGKTLDSQTGNSYHYIEKYSEMMNCSAYFACVRLLSEVEKVLNLILEKEER